MESLAVKIDKVPTLVDKIVSDSVKDSNSAEEIANELHKMQDEISLKLGRIEELASQELRQKNRTRTHRDKKKRGRVGKNNHFSVHTSR